MVAQKQPQMTCEWMSMAVCQHNYLQDGHWAAGQALRWGPRGRPAQTPSGKGTIHAKHNTGCTRRPRRPGGEEERELPHGVAVSAHPLRSQLLEAPTVWVTVTLSRGPGGDSALLPLAGK